MREIWKDVSGYEGLYEVSNLGNVRSHHVHTRRFGKYLAGGNTRGYRTLVLCKDSIRWTIMVHLLVARAFLGEPPNPKDTVNHKDFDKANNRIGNLEWISHADNNRYSARSIPRNRGEANHSKLKEHQVREIRRRWLKRETLTALGKEFGVSLQTCSAIVKRTKWAYLK